MQRGLLVGLVLGLIVLGTAVESSAQGGPALEKVWAPSEVNFGDMLKIYIKASDPEGDMRWVMISAGKSGENDPAASVPLRLKKQFRKNVNGYVYCQTDRAIDRKVEGKFVIQIEDFKGNESQPMSVIVNLVPKGAKAQKAPADFQEIPIGPIMLEAGTYYR